MSLRANRFVIGITIFLVLFAILIGMFRYQIPTRSFPKINGGIKNPNLDASVDIYRDSYGIPHIYAETSHDLFFAQGYVQAQDRFWQMDFWRHISSGRLSEMLGESQLDTDKFLRTLGWARVAREELDNCAPEVLEVLGAYSQGVNAYLSAHQGSTLSFEYVLLKLLNPSYEPEEWQPLHSIAWAKVMAWDLGGNMDDEIQRAVLLQSLTSDQLNEIDPPYPDDHPIIVSEQGIGQIANKSDPSNSSFVKSILPLLSQTSRKVGNLETILGKRGLGIGSNSWAVSGDRTSTGKPILANDPHLPAQMPSIWYEIGLHCQPKGPDCPYNVTGFSFAGNPGVIIGHNDRIAWGFTNAGPDVQDLYIEKINPDDPNQYEVNGKWVDMELVEETISVAGEDPQEMVIRYTRHGPIISDTYEPLEDFSDKTGIELPDNYALALRWTALENSETFFAILQMNQAENWDEFRAALRFFDVPSQNMVYADIEGNIGYQTPGKIPIRASGDGRIPVPGWNDNYEWLGYIPYEQLPSVYNPQEGYIVTANNAIVGKQYPYLITTMWAYGYRAQRIVDMIEGANGSVDVEYIMQMQGDNRDLNAEVLVPVLQQITLDSPEMEDARELLTGWDFQVHKDSAPAALFEVFWKHLLSGTFYDELPDDYHPEGGSRWFEVIRQLAPQPNSPWWDDRMTPEKVEGRDEIFREAFRNAVDELKDNLGDDPEKWKWGDIHTITFRNSTLGESGITLIENLFNRGPYPVSGGASIVNASGWDSSESYDVTALPSMRMIVDLSNLENSLTINTTGQSGHSYHPHYTDMVDKWRQIQYHPMLWSRNMVEEDSEGHLRLTSE